VNGIIINAMINHVFDYRLKKSVNVQPIIVFGIKVENYVMTKNAKIISTK